MQILLKRVTVLALGWVTVFGGLWGCFSGLFLEPSSYLLALLSCIPSPRGFVKC